VTSNRVGKHNKTEKGGAEKMKRAHIAVLSEEEKRGLLGVFRKTFNGTEKV